MRPSQLIAPLPETWAIYGTWVLHIRPAYAGRPGKTDEYDKGVVLDNPYRTWTRPHLAAILQYRDTFSPLWPFQAQDMSESFADAAPACGVAVLSPLVYSVRQAGASSERVTEFRSIAEVKARRGVALRCFRQGVREVRPCHARAAEALPRGAGSGFYAVQSIADIFALKAPAVNELRRFQGLLP